MHKKQHKILFLFVGCDIVDFFGKHDKMQANESKEFKTLCNITATYKKKEENTTFEILF